MEANTGFFQKVVDFMMGDLTLFNLSLKMWMVIAVTAALILIVLVVILIITGKKTSKKPEQQNDLFAPAFHTENGEREQTAHPVDDILSIGDEPTVNLDESQYQQETIIQQNDEETQDLVPRLSYLVQVQMHYDDLVLESRPILTEDNEIVIGREDACTVVTNPEDKSVSRRHGRITIQNDYPVYMDCSSKNGTDIVGARKLFPGDSIQLPLNTRIELNIGRHRVLLFIVKQ